MNETHNEDGDGDDQSTDGPRQPEIIIRQVTADQVFLRARADGQEAAAKTLLILAFAARRISEANVKAVAKAPASPPRFGGFLLSLVLPLGKDEEVLGDLEENYYLKVQRHGRFWADFHYRWWVTRILLARLIRLLFSIIPVAVLFEFLRFR